MLGPFYIGFIDFMLKVKIFLDYINLFFPNKYKRNDVLFIFILWYYLNSIIYTKAFSINLKIYFINRFWKMKKKNIPCIKCNKCRKFKSPKVSHIFNKILFLQWFVKSVAAMIKTNVKKNKKLWYQKQ